MSSPSKVEPMGLDREALERERTRLEGLLALDEAWRALKQLEERLARGEATSAVGAEALKASLERELASNRLYCVHRDVVARLAAPAVSGANSEAGGKAADAAEANALFRTKVSVKPAGAPAAMAGRAVEPAGDDDLTRIRGLTRPIAARLNSLGISRYETIAGWTRADVDRISIALGLGRAIVRQSWVDQAAILVQTRTPRALATEAPPAALPVTAAASSPPLPAPPAPPPQAVLGTLLHRRPDQPVNEPLLSLQRPRAGLGAGPAAAADMTMAARAAPVEVGAVAAPKATAAAVGPPGPTSVMAKTSAGPISVAARAAAMAVNRSAAAPLPAVPAVPVAANGASRAVQAATATPTAPAATARAATAPSPVAPPPASAAPAAKPSAYADRIDLIDGLGPDAIAALVKAGVTQAAQIAAFRGEDVRRWRRDLGDGVQAPFTHVIEQAAMLAGGQLPAAACKVVEGRAASPVPRPAPADWGRPLLLDRLQREAEEATRPKSPDEADRLARRSLREALAGGDPMRAAFATTMTTARTRLVDRLALIDLPRKPRGSSDDVVAAFEERMAALQRDLDEMERRLRAEPAPKGADSAVSQPRGVDTTTTELAQTVAVGEAVAAVTTAAPAEVLSPATSSATKPEPEPVCEPAVAKRGSDEPAKPVAPIAPEATAPATQTGDAGARGIEPDPLIGLGEADVVIVAKAPPPRPVESPAAGPAALPVVSAESLVKRLRRFGSAEPIEAEDYAAYHGEVEEAAVEIVRGPRVSSLPKSPGNGAAAPTTAAGERNSAIKRFVRALSGGP